MKKRGDFNISFGIIFSIIVIIAIIAIAFYVITKFVGLSKCTEIGLFYDNLKDHVEKAWQSTISEDTLKATLPSKIEFICFGNLNQSPPREYREIYNSLSKSFINFRDRNVFIYPIENACDTELSSIKLDHVKIDNFFCIPVKDRKIEIKTKKSQFDALVTIYK